MENQYQTPTKRLYRNPDDKRVGGVCSGLSIFFGIDVVLIRVIFLIALFFGTCGFWMYLAVWIAAPEALTADQKCELHGLPKTEDNLKRFTR